MSKDERLRVMVYDLEPNESWELMDYLLMAVHATCIPMGWEWHTERRSDTFCKVVATLTNAMGTTIEAVNVFFDLDNPGRLYKSHLSPRAESVAFEETLRLNLSLQVGRYVESFDDPVVKRNRALNIKMLSQEPTVELLREYQLEMLEINKNHPDMEVRQQREAELLRELEKAETNQEKRLRESTLQRYREIYSQKLKPYPTFSDKSLAGRCGLDRKTVSKIRKLARDSGW